MVLNKSGRVIADSAGEFRGRTLGHPEIQTALRGQNSAAPYFEPEYGWVLYLAVPVNSGQQVVGAVFLSADINQLVRQLDEIRRSLIWFSVISGLVVFLISLFLGRFLTRPLKRLIVAAGKITAGDYGYRVRELGGNDELGELTRVFNEMSSRIREEDNIRKRFVADASHELKSPVAAIKALLESWPGAGQAGPGETLELVEDLKFEADKLGKLVEDLLVLSRIEGNIKQLNLEETSVGELVEAVRRTAVPMARNKGLEVVTKHGGDVYWHLDGDKMFRALLNLVDNGIKYSAGPGTVVLGFRIDDGKLVFHVTNTGEGIPPEETGNIFNRFYRVDKARSRKTGGWGLGLAIVKEIVELHRGEISVTSEPGGMTVFTVELPGVS
jgi:signal transduction histidine kinase